MRALVDRGSSVGTHIISPWPGIVEIVGRTGQFDYVELVGEYSPWDLQGLDNFARAAELCDLGTVFKVEEQLAGFVATRAIDAGFEALLFTDCRSAKAVSNCIALVRPETPNDRGVHGCGLRRSVCYDLEISSSEAWREAMRKVVIIIMIEKKWAMDELGAILKIPGVDMIQFGPGDYSITIGKYAGDVLDIQKQMIEKALKAGVAPRVELPTADGAEPFIELGVRHFCIGWDVDAWKRFCLKEGGRMNALLKS